jgi:hypothetical protein
MICREFIQYTLRSLHVYSIYRSAMSRIYMCRAALQGSGRGSGAASSSSTCSACIKDLYQALSSPAVTSLEMKDFYILVLLLFATVVLGESIQIGSPPNGTQVTPGQQINVEVIEPVRSCVFLFASWLA